MGKRCVVGVDLGGTNVRACSLYEDATEAGKRFSSPSNGQGGTESILDAVASTVEEAVKASESPPEAVGLAIPGHIDNVAGVVRWAPNLGGMVAGTFVNWTDVAIRAPLEKRLGLPVQMGNDANLAALGEYAFGSGKNSAKCLVLLTLGTGIGGGVVMAPTSVFGDARGPLMLLGGNQGGVELGHILILRGGLDCNAGSYGSLEAYCQRDAIVRRALHKLRRGRRSTIADRVGGDLAKVTPKTISDAAADRDEVAIEVWNEVGEILGLGIGTCINVFAPDIFAIGGQMAKAGDYLMDSARRAARDIAIPSLFADCEIVPAVQQDDAGLLGAAMMAVNWLSHADTSKVGR